MKTGRISGCGPAPNSEWTSPIWGFDYNFTKSNLNEQSPFISNKNIQFNICGKIFLKTT